MKHVLWMVVLAVATVSGQAADEAARAAVRARQNAQTFQNNATTISLYDRDGRMVGSIGERALYNQPVFSPDGARIAVIKNDLDAEAGDLWVVEVGSGSGLRITNSGRREFVPSPVWSPDGTQLAYVTLRDGWEGIYRKPSNGAGAEELVYKNPGFDLLLGDWSADGRFLSFAKSDLTGGTVYVMPLGQADNQPVEVFRSESRIRFPRFSPSGRYLSYDSIDAAGRTEAFVRPVDPASGVGPWLVSNATGGPLSWRKDGKELYFIGADRSVMATEVSDAATFDLKVPRVLFRPAGAIPLVITAISADGERFLALRSPRAPQLQQITIFDREGQAIRKLGEPGVYVAPAFSPDGSRVAVRKTDMSTGRVDFWIFDVATGNAIPMKNDVVLNGPPMWSPDGRHILYVSTRGSYSGIYRKTWDGTGSEELLFRYTPGAGLQLTDISPDGKLLAFSSGGVVLVVPLTGTDPLARQAIEFAREEYEVDTGRFSPNGRFIAYRSNELGADRFHIYVRPLDAATGRAGDRTWQVSKTPAAFMLHWRADGKEFFYRDFNEPGDTDLRVMSVDVTIAPTVVVGTPKVLFTVRPGFPGNLGNISRNGQYFVFAVNVPAE